jgi:hypothetical protein
MKGEASGNVYQLEVLADKSRTAVEISGVERIEQGANDGNMVFC